MSKKILIVDDELDIVMVLSARLREHGYETPYALNAKQAFLEIEKHKPDLIILDIMLPDMGGDAIASKLKEDPQTRKIPVIFLSALQTKKEEHSQDGFIGGNVVLAKPFEMDILLKKIKEMV